MKVLNLAAGADTGGQGIRIKQAFDRHSDIGYRAACLRQTYIGYPTDMRWRIAMKRLPEFDVYHMRNRVLTRLVDGAKAFPIPDRPKVVHFHGTDFRTNLTERLDELRTAHASGLVATLDLWLAAPDDVDWLPAPYNLEWLNGFRRHVDDGILRIGHSPTDRSIKSTDLLIEAVKRLGEERPVQLVMTERQPWRHCLAVKGTVDVFFDQVILGYGNNAIEAWGMGIPVVAGAQPDTLAEMHNRFGDLPFYEATEDTIYQALADLADPTTRSEWGTRGLAHVERFHDEELVVRQLEQVYLSAVEQE